MEDGPEEFIVVYEKIRHTYEHVSGIYADTDLNDAIRSIHKNFTPTVEVGMTALELLENKNLSVAAKNDVRTLKLELRFLRTAFRCLVKWGFEDRMQGFMGILARIQCQFVCANQVLDPYVRKENFGIVEAVDFDAVACNVLENIKIIKPEILEAYYLLSLYRLSSKYPMSVKLQVEFIYMVMDTLGVLFSYCGAVPSKCKQVLTTTQKSNFIAEFIWFTINQGLHGAKLNEILISAEALADSAAGFSYFLWIDSEVNQMIEIKLINLDARHISAGTLKTLQQFDSGFF